MRRSGSRGTVMPVRSWESRRRAGVSLEAGPQRRRGVVQSGLGRPERDAKAVGDLGQRQPEVVVEHEDGALLEGEPPEGAVELVAVVDGQEIAGLG